MGLLIKDNAYAERWKKQTAIKSARNHVVKPGRHYALVDRRGGQKDRVQKRMVAGQEVRLEDGIGFVQDAEIAKAAAEQGFYVVEREQGIPSGRSFWSVPEMPWKRGNG